MKTSTLLRLLIGVAVAYWSILIFQIPLFQLLPGWFWEFVQKPLGAAWLIIPLAVVSYAVLAIILNNSGRTLLNLVLLILLGYGIQMSFGFMENRGIDGIRDRLVVTGHAEFAYFASVEENIPSVVSHYEELVQSGRLGVFAETKPPGTLLAYMLTQKVAAVFIPAASPFDRYLRLVTFASYFHPFLCSLVVIPLYFFSRLFFEPKLAFCVCLLYLFLPNVALMTLHLDQVVYPTLTMSTLCLLAYACRRNSLVLAVLSGVLMYASVFASFSLTALLPLACLMLFSWYVVSPYGEKGTARFLKVGISFFAGLLLVGLVCRVTLGYDIFARYQNAMAVHQAWKGWNPTAWNSFLLALTDYVEYAVWIGVPVAFLFSLSAFRVLAQVLKRRDELITLLGVSLLIIFLLLGIFGKTMGEVGRLWLFLSPLVCVFAVYEVSHRFKENPGQFMTFLLALQLVTIFVIKRYQDFH